MRLNPTLIAAAAVPLALSLACASGGGPDAPPAVPPADGPAPSPADVTPSGPPPAVGAAPADLPDLAAYAAGARVASAQAVGDDGAIEVEGAGHLLDESILAAWSGGYAFHRDTTFVIELAARAAITHAGVRFDPGVYDPAATPERITLSVADGPEGPWAPLATLSTGPGTADLVVPAAGAGRYVRLEYPRGRDADRWSHLAELVIHGTLEPVAPIDPAGRYDGGWLLGAFEIGATPAGHVGCFVRDGRPLSAIADGRTLAVRWSTEEGHPAVALLVPGPDGRFQGLSQAFPPGEGPGAVGLVIVESAPEGERCLPEPGASAPSELEAGLAADGRVRVYSLLFDFNRDTPRPESAAVLDELAGILRAHPEWRLRVEGHTDSVGGDAANQDLSERRARAAVAGLVERGIDAGRLEAAGLGESAPVAPNDSPTGRAQNRRVELVRLDG